MAGVLIVFQLHQLASVKQLLIVILVSISHYFWGSRYLFCFGVGFVLASVTGISAMNQRLDGKLEGKDIQVLGVVSDLPKYDNRRVQFDLEVTSAKLAGKTVKLPAHIRLNWYRSDQSIQAGATGIFIVRLKRPHGTLNPGGFDYERWLMSHDIGATGYVRQWLGWQNGNLIDDWFSLAYWRQTLADRISKTLENRETVGLVKALVIGDKQEISSSQWQIFRQTGTSHLIAISGLHIGLVAGLVYFFALKLWARWGGFIPSPPKFAAVCAMLAALFYAALSGFSIPTQRALCMLVVVMSSILLKRHVSPMHQLTLALFIVVLLDSFAVTEPGFWLSFFAVFLIIYMLAARRKPLGKVLTFIKINTLIAFGLTPLLILFFNQTSMIAPIANFLAVPVVSFWLVPLSLVAVILLGFSDKLAELAFDIVSLSLQYLMDVLAVLAAFPFAEWHFPSPTWVALLLAVAGILLLLAPRGIPARWLSIPLLLPLTVGTEETIARSRFKVTLLDVGQGLSAVVMTENHSLVFDAGDRYSDNFDMGKNVVLPFLYAKNRSSVDVLLISHGDSDHIGGAQSVIKGIQVNKMLSSVPEVIDHNSIKNCQAGQHWRWDNVSFEILAPDKQPFRDENDNSCVLKVTSSDGSVLLTGDIERSAENWLVNTYKQQLRADVLVAPHHGSKTSSSSRFLAQVKPTAVLIPAGYRNRFGFPHPDILQRYRDIKADSYNVAKQGAITVRFQQGSYKIKSYRNSNGKFWNH